MDVAPDAAKRSGVSRQPEGSVTPDIEGLAVPTRPGMIYVRDAVHVPSLLDLRNNLANVPPPHSMLLLEGHRA
jgi:hypothetical protein